MGVRQWRQSEGACTRASVTACVYADCLCAVQKRIESETRLRNTVLGGVPARPTDSSSTVAFCSAMGHLSVFDAEMGERTLPPACLPALRASSA
jgi:hypothetical protein